MSAVYTLSIIRTHQFLHTFLSPGFHAAPAIASQVAVGTMTSIGTAISHTASVYNPVTVGTTTITAGMTTAGRFLIGAAEGGALAVANGEHILTRTYGYRGALTAETEAGMSFRAVLARDIQDIRSIVGSKYNQGMLDLLKYYRANFPELIAK
jgi:hypothetical protein